MRGGTPAYTAHSWLANDIQHLRSTKYTQSNDAMMMMQNKFTHSIITAF